MHMHYENNINDIVFLLQYEINNSRIKWYGVTKKMEDMWGPRGTIKA